MIKTLRITFEAWLSSESPFGCELAKVTVNNGDVVEKDEIPVEDLGDYITHVIDSLGKPLKMRGEIIITYESD